MATKLLNFIKCANKHVTCSKKTNNFIIIMMKKKIAFNQISLIFQWINKQTKKNE